MSTVPHPRASPSDLAGYCEDLARRARAAAGQLATAAGAAKDRWLHEAARAVEERGAEVLEANAKDLAGARDNGLSPAQIDRLRLTPERLRAAADGLRQVASLPDPVGQVRESRRRPNGLEV